MSLEGIGRRRWSVIFCILNFRLKLTRGDVMPIAACKNSHISGKVGSRLRYWKTQNSIRVTLLLSYAEWLRFDGNQCDWKNSRRLFTVSVASKLQSLVRLLVRERRGVTSRRRRSCSRCFDIKYIIRRRSVCVVVGVDGWRTRSIASSTTLTSYAFFCVKVSTST